MLIFVGLGLFDEKDISVKGLEAVRKAEHVFLEAYTSRLMGTKICEMEEFFQRKIKVVTREDVEQHHEKLIEFAKDDDVVLLTGGDPMVSTTHADLRIRGARAGIETRIIHGSSIISAVCGLSGLQNYRFGKSCSLPFPAPGWFPTTPLDVILQNRDRDLHTLVYLDIQTDRFMTIREAVALIEQMSEKCRARPPERYVGIARAGSVHPVVIAGDGEKLKTAEFGPPLHILIVPGELHHMEQEYLETFADL
jgi:diphthine synthase